ncbi:MAG: hypothetical protein SGJ19_25795 [Planctomycetia bacterium]|nr:hypothetical protein [Planctomycetia bacterium]
MTIWISRARSFTALLAASLVLAVGSFANAGTVQLTAHAHDSTGELHITKSASHPTTAYADTGNVNKPGAHARSWGAAFISGGSLKKAAGGEGWVINGNSAKHQYWYANAGTGEFIVNGEPGINSARVRLLIQRSGEVIDPVQPVDAPPEIGDYPSQAMFAEYDFTVNLQLDAAITQEGQKFDLFHGQASLAGPQSVNPGLSMTGDFALLSVFEPTQFQGNPGQQRLGALTPNLVLSPGTATVLTNVPFTVDLDLIMSQYVIDGFPFEPPLVDTGGILASSSGDLVVELLVEDAAGNPLTITPVVPEPGTLSLGALCALGASWSLRRRGLLGRRA